MKYWYKNIVALAIFNAALGVYSPSAIASTFTLYSGEGDGSVTLDVDVFGSLKSAIYDPLGELNSEEVVSQSGVAIQLSGADSRLFLDTAGTEITRTQTSATSASSSFSLDNLLNFDLDQTLTPLFANDTQAGSLLTQTYSITNTTHSSLDFELLRLFDGIPESSPSEDGGGRLFAQGQDILFQTNTPTGTPNDPTFIGITAQGGIIPVDNRYDIDNSRDLSNRITSGGDLTDTIRGDGVDGDHFIDADVTVDVALALNNVFSLGVGETVTYTTQTIFGLAPEREETEFLITAQLADSNIFGQTVTIQAVYTLGDTPDLDPDIGEGLYEVSSWDGVILDLEGNVLAELGLGAEDRVFVEVFNPQDNRGSTSTNRPCIIITTSDGRVFMLPDRFTFSILFDSFTNPDQVPNQGAGDLIVGLFAPLGEDSFEPINGIFDLGDNEPGSPSASVTDGSVVLLQPVPEPSILLGLAVVLCSLVSGKKIKSNQ